MASQANGTQGTDNEAVQAVVYRCGPLRGLCVPGYESFDLGAIPWDDLQKRSDPNHELAKSSRTRRVVRLEFAPPGQPVRGVFAKRARVRDWRKRIGYLYVPSKARREWTAGYRLLEMGFHTPQPLVWADHREGPWLRENYLVTEEILDAASLREKLVRAESCAARRRILTELARWLWQLHQRGAYHDDCSAEHVFVGPRETLATADRREFWLIDLDNCRFHHAAVPWNRRIKNLFQLLRSIPPRAVSRTDRLRFVCAYLESSGESPRLRRAVGRLRRLARAKEADIHL
jgi:hypothetical protein